MAENLKKLYNTLLLIETKGESTKIMAECLTFTMDMIKKAEKDKVSVEKDAQFTYTKYERDVIQNGNKSI